MACFCLSREEDPQCTYACAKCGKPITADEFVVNVGYCEDCLNQDFDEYQKKQKGEELPI